MRLSEMSLDAMQSDLTRREPTERVQPLDCGLAARRRMAHLPAQTGNCSAREIANEPGEGLSGLGDLVFVVT